jgi:hypothetical protein
MHIQGELGRSPSLLFPTALSTAGILVAIETIGAVGCRRPHVMCQDARVPDQRPPRR